jgi:glutathione synthase/RimK-type ligase-like ATP-grasp enzyme
VAIDWPTEEFVLKPTVGAGSKGAGRFDPTRDGVLESARAHAAALHAAERTVMVQPYLGDVDRDGEAALLYFDGEFSHSITKGAMLPEGTVHPQAGHDLYVEERITPHDASEAEVAVGAKAIALLHERFGRDLLYTRVDLLPGPDGPVVIELEVAEPSVFLNYADGAADRFAAAIAATA